MTGLMSTGSVLAERAQERLEALENQREAHEHVRGHFGRGLDEHALGRVAELFAPPAWSSGSIGLLDAMFVYDMVQMVRPARVPVYQAARRSRLYGRLPGSSLATARFCIQGCLRTC